MPATIEKISSDKHDGDAVCIAHHDGQVISAGADGKIKIWNTDLNLIKTVNAHDSYIFAMAINSAGKIYSSCCDGNINYILPPYDNDNVHGLFQCEDSIQSLYCDMEDILYTGDDKGVVTNWHNDKLLFKFNLVEEVKSMAAEQSIIYTVRDLDVCISLVVAGKSGKYSNRAVIPGKSPLTLFGPMEMAKDQQHRTYTYLAFADRTGMGLSLVNNLPHLSYTKIWDMPHCHEMIVNGLCGNESCLYSGGYDGKVKGWTDLAGEQPKALGTVDVGNCVNAICCGSDNYVYIAASDGLIRRAKFV